MRPEPFQVESFTTVDELLARVGGFLEAREAEHNLLFGILANLRADPDISDGEPTLVAVCDGPRVVAAGLRTPPFPFVLSMVDDDRAIDVLADHLSTDPTMPGVNAPVRWALPLAEAIAARTGRRTHVSMAERIYRLTKVIPPRHASGRMRTATLEDREVVVAWLRAFGLEALPEEDQRDVEDVADRWLRGETVRTLYLWEDGGCPVSLTGAGGPTPHGIRIGPVYTPPELRGRGYASNLVAACTQAELDKGRMFAFLFTDLANPTSNSVYMKIGYEPVSDILVVRLEPPA